MSAIKSGVLSRLKAKMHHFRVRQLSRRDWLQRHAKVMKLNPTCRTPCASSVEQAHVRFWRQLRPDISLDTLRICQGISGKSSLEIIPEEVYVSEVEPCLNRYREAAFLANKNCYNRWFPGTLFPEVFLHNIDGDFYDSDYQPLSLTSATLLMKDLPYPVVLKPSLGPGGGRGVYFVKDVSELQERIKGERHFVVQRLIRQHPFFAKFNEVGLNTLRICTYRSVMDGEIHVLNVTMRMGRGGCLDNETAGGIVCNINDDGSLNHYALDKYGVKYFEHPDTGLKFGDAHIVPQLAALKDIAKHAARDIYLTRLASLDASMDESGAWRLIETNLFNQTIRFAQYAGKPFLGQWTGEVVEYCKQHPTWR